MTEASPRTLKILAALVWYIGGFVLAVKGGALLREANLLKPEQDLSWLVILTGLLIGGVKAKYLFSRSCRKNLARIDQLNKPKLWQFYRPWFFLFLALMITLGASLSRMAHGDYAFLISVAILDFSLATALLASSYVFWQQRAFMKSRNMEQGGLE